MIHGVPIICEDGSLRAPKITVWVSSKHCDIRVIPQEGLCEPNSSVTMLLLLALCVVALLSSLAQCSSIKCSYNMYGRPSTSDAAAVVQAMPFARKDPDDQMAATRIFAEPTYLKPSFNYLKNEWPTRMVQLPMIWRFSKFYNNDHRTQLCLL